MELPKILETISWVENPLQILFDYQKITVKSPIDAYLGISR